VVEVRRGEHLLEPMLAAWLATPLTHLLHDLVRGWVWVRVSVGVGVRVRGRVRG
jgi:hypothetical protein